MSGTDRGVSFALQFLLEHACGIRTTEVKAMGQGKFIPQLFEPNSCFVLPLCPQDGDHFTEHNYTPVFHRGGFCPANCISKSPKKTLAVRSDWIHKLA